MKFGEFISLIGAQSYFDLQTVVQLTADDRQNVRTQLYRWTKEGKLLSLRRGMFTLAEPYRRIAVKPTELSNVLYKPSYLSERWALAYYGVIPEKVVSYTSATPRVSKCFTNAFGQFIYRRIKQSVFGGYRSAEIDRRKVLLADPEKALLDLWYLEPGPWTRQRMQEMRFQNFDAIDVQKLAEAADLFRSPRLQRAIAHWNALAEEDGNGSVQL